MQILSQHGRSKGIWDKKSEKAPQSPCSVTSQNQAASLHIRNHRELPRIPSCIYTRSKEPEQPDFARISPSTSLLHVHEQDFETIAQALHVLIRHLLQLVRAGDNPHRPRAHFGFWTQLEAQQEIARVLRVDAEGVGAAARVGFGVGC